MWPTRSELIPVSVACNVTVNVFGAQVSEYLFQLYVSERFSLLKEKSYSGTLWYTHNVHESPTIWWWWSRGRRWWWWWRDGGWSYCCCSLGYTGDEFIWKLSLVCLVLHLFLKSNHKLKKPIRNQHRTLSASNNHCAVDGFYNVKHRSLFCRRNNILKKSRLTTTFSKVVCSSVARSLYSSDRMSSWISERSES